MLFDVLTEISLKLGQLYSKQWTSEKAASEKKSSHLKTDHAEIVICKSVESSSSSTTGVCWTEYKLNTLIFYILTISLTSGLHRWKSPSNSAEHFWGIGHGQSTEKLNNPDLTVRLELLVLHFPLRTWTSRRPWVGVLHLAAWPLWPLGCRTCPWPAQY